MYESMVSITFEVVIRKRCITAMNMQPETISKSYLLSMVLLGQEVILKKSIRLILRVVLRRIALYGSQYSISRKEQQLPVTSSGRTLSRNLRNFLFIGSYTAISLSFN